jgi:hypothetical protein
MKIRFTSTALFEIDEIIVYIGKHNPLQGSRPGASK